MTARIDAVVFDLDGLLVDSEPVQIAAWERFLLDQGRSLDPELLARMFGLRVWDSAALLIDELALALTVDVVVRLRDEVFFALLRGAVRPMPGAQALVADLTARNLPLALATSGHRRYVATVLDELGLRGAFAVEVTGDDVLRGKPDPEIYRAATERLGVPPCRCLALEDAPLGIASATAAGLRCLAIPNAMTANLPGLDCAEAVLGSLGEVIPWLTRQGLLGRSSQR